MTVEQATESLLAFMSELDGETRSMKKREITEVFTLGGFNETRAIGSSEDTPLVYLFNFADDRGYALMSGDTRVGDVLAFVEKGNLDLFVECRYVLSAQNRFTCVRYGWQLDRIDER